MVRKERLELSILSAVASKTTVYTIPPLAQNCQLKFLMNVTNCLVCNYYIVIVCFCQHLFKNNLVRLERLEPSIPKAADFKSAVYTIPPQSHILVPPPGIEPGSSVLQTGAMTTSAKAAFGVKGRMPLLQIT
jgi:hypothetical protein